jgi:hypothetical protein
VMLLLHCSVCCVGLYAAVGFWLQWDKVHIAGTEKSEENS